MKWKNFFDDNSHRIFVVVVILWKPWKQSKIKCKEITFHISFIKFLLLLLSLNQTHQSNHPQQNKILMKILFKKTKVNRFIKPVNKIIDWIGHCCCSCCRWWWWTLKKWKYIIRSNLWIFDHLHITKTSKIEKENRVLFVTKTYTHTEEKHTSQSFNQPYLLHGKNLENQAILVNIKNLLLARIV